MFCTDINSVLMTSTAAPPRLSYNVEVKLVNLGENFQIPKPGSTEFDILANTVSSGFSGALGKLPGFYKLHVNQFQE
jgi:hypothetical protein